MDDRSYLTTEISKPQNALAVSDDNDLNAPLRPVLENLKDLAPEQNETKYVSSDNNSS
jgi:hypothetical protein